MRLPTVKLRNKKTGELRKVNAIDYAMDLGKDKYAGWELIGEQRGDPVAPEDQVVIDTASGRTRVSKQEVENADTAEKETPGYRSAKSRAAARRAKDEEYLVKKED
jgi:hypothetical protein